MYISVRISNTRHANKTSGTECTNITQVHDIRRKIRVIIYINHKCHQGSSHQNNSECRKEQKSLYACTMRATNLGAAPVLAAAQGLNVAVAAVNAAVAAQQASQAAGNTVSQQAITEAATAYQALKNVQITTSQAQASVASGTVAPAPAAAS